MRIIGVIDLLHGRAVHARGGRRQEYAPVERVWGSSVRPGDPLDLARHYVHRLGIGELYVADLDAILGGAPQPIGDIVALGAPVWLDAGTTSPEQAARALDAGASHVVVGLETLSSLDALACICQRMGPGRSVAFSLDLRDGAPLVSGRGTIAASSSLEWLASSAAAAGAASTIVLDLARVGTGSGLDADVIARVRGAVPGGVLIAGGGIRHRRDLEGLSEAGCDGALVATALHRGAIGAADIADVRASSATSRPPRTPAARSPA